MSGGNTVGEKGESHLADSQELRSSSSEASLPRAVSSSARSRGSLSPESRLGPPSAIWWAVAGGLPLVAYIATASGHAYWLDSSEFVAQAASLGISHPPAHPLQGTLGFIAGLVPIGSLAFRLAILSAVMTAVAASFLFGAADACLRSVPVFARRVRYPLALAAAWSAAGSHAFWFQAVRPEVYALQAALTAVVIERLCSFEARGGPKADPGRDVRPLYVAALALGFALSNHHFLALLCLPAAAPTLARVLRNRGPKPLLWMGAAVSTGLLTYLYLPLRASRSPALNLGDPDSLDRFRWVVTAEAFQKNTGDGVPQPLGDRLMDVLVQLGLGLHPAVLLLAVVGLYVSLRLPSTRRVGAFLGLVLGLHVLARAWLGFVRDNPDALGYLMPAFASLAILAAVALGSLAMVIKQHQRPGALTSIIASALLAASVYPSLAVASRGGLAHFKDTHRFDGPLRRDLASRAVLLAHNPQTIFRYWGGQAEDGLRSDVILVPIPFLAYPGMVDDLLEREPELRALLQSYLVHGRLRQPELQSLAIERPVLVEMDPRVPTALFDTLVPEGLYYRVLPDGATSQDVSEGAARSDAIWNGLYARIGLNDEGLVIDDETRNQLLWRHYLDALYFAATGHPTEARQSIDRGLALEPESAELLALQQAMVGVGDEPLDISPFQLVPGQL